MIAADLARPSWECVHFLGREEAQRIGEGLDQLDVVARTVESQGIRAHDDLLWRVGKALAFPDSYFGHGERNHDQLNDWIRDLSWLPAAGYVLRVRDAETLWREVPEVGGGMMNSWLLAAEYWATRQVSFHLLFQWGER